MKHKSITRTAATLFVAFSVAASATSVTVSTVSGDVKASKGDAAPAAVSQGDSLSSGTTVHTGRDGRLTAAFDADNSIEVMPESVLKINGNSNGLRGAVLVLEKGRVRSNLQSWPARKAYRVKTKAGAFKAEGTDFGTSYRLGPGGEFVGGTDVSQGEVSYTSPEMTISSITAGGGVSVERTVGVETVLLKVSAVGNAITIKVAGVHVIDLPAGSTILIAIRTATQGQAVAVKVVEGSATVGGTTLTPASGAVFIAGTEVLDRPNAEEFMNAVQAEASANAQAQLPGLTPEEIAKLKEQQQNAANDVRRYWVGGGFGPQFQAPFVPDRPIGFTLSPSGNP